VLEWNIFFKQVVLEFLNLLFPLWNSFGFLVVPDDGLLMNWSKFVEVLMWHFNKCVGGYRRNNFFSAIIVRFDLKALPLINMDVCNLEAEVWEQ